MMPRLTPDEIADWIPENPNEPIQKPARVKGPRRKSVPPKSIRRKAQARGHLVTSRGNKIPIIAAYPNEHGWSVLIPGQAKTRTYEHGWNVRKWRSHPDFYRVRPFSSRTSPSGERLKRPRLMYHVTVPGKIISIQGTNIKELVFDGKRY